ncbi:MAG: VCBS repeat-containing protein, partial [Halobacteriales archaeon]|nr:VCBS repeat-containing protein [Halobacteriales archaeon]
MAIVALNHDGTLRWEQRPAWANPLSYTHLVAADVDGDGSKEVLGFDWNTIGHKPGNWEVLPTSHAFAFSAAGKELWHRDVENYWSNDDIAAADLDGDGKLEMLVNGVDQGHDGVWVLDAASGAPREHWSTWPWKTMRGPELGDLDRDGHMEVVVSVAAESRPSHGGAFVVFRVQGLGALPAGTSTAQTPAATPAGLPGPGGNATAEPAGLPASGGNATAEPAAPPPGHASPLFPAHPRPHPPGAKRGLLGVGLLGL